MMRPGSLGSLWKSLYFLSKLKRTQKIYVWLQFSSNLNIEELRFLRISSPSLFSPTLSRFSMSSLVKSYSASSKILSSLTSFIISLHEHALWTMVIKYLANLRGMSSTDLSKMSINTWVKALTKSLEVLIRASLFYSMLHIISLRLTKASTLFERSPYFS